MPKIEAPSVPEHRELVHRRIFDAFSDLMGERSFDAITMAQVAARAGVGRTAIYHHFRDKDAIVVALAADETERYLTALRADLDRVVGPVAKLRVYVTHQLAAGQQFHTGMGGILSHLLSAAAMREIRAHVAAVEAVLDEILSDGIALGVFDVPDRRSAVLLLHSCLAPREVPAEAITQFVLRGLGCYRG